MARAFSFSAERLLPAVRIRRGAARMRMERLRGMTAGRGAPCELRKAGDPRPFAGLLRLRRPRKRPTFDPRRRSFP
ncbi:MAG TPA: hypothetical protein DEA40_00930 [Parvularcula sp.]|nr:hypothetical protein [Parvularcula sp.]